MCRAPTRMSVIRIPISHHPESQAHKLLICSILSSVDPLEPVYLYIEMHEFHTSFHLHFSMDETSIAVPMNGRKDNRKQANKETKIYYMHVTFPTTEKSPSSETFHITQALLFPLNNKKIKLHKAPPQKNRPITSRQKYLILVCLPLPPANINILAILAART